MEMEQSNSDKNLIKLAKDEAWRRGILVNKLDAAQKTLYAEFYDAKHKLTTWLLSRRNGKSYLLCVLALEQCLRHPNSIVKFVSPTKAQVFQNIRPILKQILDDCPNDVNPEFRKNDYTYYFANGSELQLAGSDKGHAERLRGSDSHLYFVDEAGSCSDLNNLLKSILMPTTLITKGRGILASTPPKDSEHEFLNYIEEAQQKGSLTIKTIDDNPRITQEQRQELIEELGGINSEECRRELFCEIIKDSVTAIIPEFDNNLAKEVVKEWPKPPYYDAYEAMDTGGKDFTVVLYGYYDFRAGRIVIEDETVIDFQDKDSNIGKLVEEIHQKEVTLWTNVISGEYKSPHKRVSDIDYIFITEIMNQSKKIHRPEQVIAFQIAKKDDKAAAINSLRVMMASKKIIIHPRCVTLIRHLHNAKWDKNKIKFARSVDNGHYDAVDALIYFVRHIDYSKNPYPKGYDLNMQGLFIYNQEKLEQKQNNQLEIYKMLFNVPRKRKW